MFAAFGKIYIVLSKENVYFDFIAKMVIAKKNGAIYGLFG